MFEKKELEATLDYIDQKKDDILNDSGGSDLDYLRNLQTLTKLEIAAEEKLDSMKECKKERE